MNVSNQSHAKQSERQRRNNIQIPLYNSLFADKKNQPIHKNSICSDLDEPAYLTDSTKIISIANLDGNQKTLIRTIANKSNYEYFGLYSVCISAADLGAVLGMSISTLNRTVTSLLNLPLSPIRVIKRINKNKNLRNIYIINNEWIKTLPCFLKKHAVDFSKSKFHLIRSNCTYDHTVNLNGRSLLNNTLLINNIIKAFKAATKKTATQELTETHDENAANQKSINISDSEKQIFATAQRIQNEMKNSQDHADQQSPVEPVKVNIPKRTNKHSAKDVKKAFESGVYSRRTPPKKMPSIHSDPNALVSHLEKLRIHPSLEIAKQNVKAGTSAITGWVNYETGFVYATSHDDDGTMNFATGCCHGTQAHQIFTELYDIALEAAYQFNQRNNQDRLSKLVPLSEFNESESDLEALSQFDNNFTCFYNPNSNAFDSGRVSL